MGRKAVACAIALSILHSIAVVPVAQANLWSERRSASRAAKTEHGMRAANAQSMDATGAQPAQALLAQLPSLPAGPGSPDWAAASVGAQLNRLSAQGPSTDLSPQPFAAPAWLKSLPLHQSNLKRASIPDGWQTSDPIVIHIQDVHLNYEAQKNISATVRRLLEAGRLDLVGLEGSFETMDFSRFGAFEDRRSVEKAADYLLKTGKISGAVHAALGDGTDRTRFEGLDDPARYRAHVGAYLRSRESAARLKASLSAYNAELEKEKSGTFNPALREFDAAVSAYRGGTSSLGDYVRHLSRYAASSSEIRTFLRALDAESRIDFAAVERERAEIVRRLAASMGRGPMSRLLDASVAYRMGRMRGGDFYGYLRQVCGDSGVDFSRYAAMDSYLSYVLMSDGISAERLMDETERAEAAGYRALARTRAENDLVERSKWASLTGKLLDYALSPREWNEYRRLASAEAGARALALLGAGSAFDLAPFESFFNEAVARDGVMADRLVQLMESRKTSAAVIVTGGFHSAGIEERLRKRGIAVLTLAPKISKVDDGDGAAYLTAFAQEKTPLEKLFQGEKIFVTPEVFPPSAELTAAALIPVVSGAGRGALKTETVNAAFHELSGPRGDAYNVTRAEVHQGVPEATLAGPGRSERFRVELDSNEEIASIRYLHTSGTYRAAELFTEAVNLLQKLIAQVRTMAAIPYNAYVNLRFGLKSPANFARVTTDEWAGAWHAGDVSGIVADAILDMTEATLAAFTAGLSWRVRASLRAIVEQIQELDGDRSSFIYSAIGGLEHDQKMEMLYGIASQSGSWFNRDWRETVIDLMEGHYAAGKVQVLHQDDFSLVVSLDRPHRKSLKLQISVSNNDSYSSDPKNHSLAQFRVAGRPYEDYQYGIILQEKLFYMGEDALAAVLGHEVEEITMRHNFPLRGGEWAHRRAIKAAGGLRAEALVQERLAEYERDVAPALRNVAPNPSGTLIWFGSNHAGGNAPLSVRSIQDLADLLPMPPHDTWVVVHSGDSYPNTLKVWLCVREKGETEEQFRQRIDTEDYRRSLLFDLVLQEGESPGSVWLRHGRYYPRLRNMSAGQRYSTADWMEKRLEPWLWKRGFKSVSITEFPINQGYFKPLGFVEDKEVNGTKIVSKALRDPRAALSRQGVVIGGLTAYRNTNRKQSASMGEILAMLYTRRAQLGEMGSFNPGQDRAQWTGIDNSLLIIPFQRLNILVEFGFLRRVARNPAAYAISDRLLQAAPEQIQSVLDLPELGNINIPEEHRANVQRRIDAIFSAQDARGGAWHSGDMAAVLSGILLDASAALVARFTLGTSDRLRAVVAEALTRSRAASGARRETLTETLAGGLTHDELMGALHQWNEKSNVRFKPDLQDRVVRSLERLYPVSGGRSRIVSTHENSLFVHLIRRGHPTLRINFLLADRLKMVSDPLNHVLAQFRPIELENYDFSVVIQKRLFDFDDEILDIVIKHEIEEIAAVKRRNVTPEAAHQAALQAVGGAAALVKVQSAVRSYNEEMKDVRRFRRSAPLLFTALREPYVRSNLEELKSIRRDAGSYANAMGRDYERVFRFCAYWPEPPRVLRDLISLHRDKPEDPSRFVALLPKLDQILGEEWIRSNWDELIDAYRSLGGERLERLIESDVRDPRIQSRDRKWLQENFLSIPNLLHPAPERDVDVVKAPDADAPSTHYFLFNMLKRTLRAHPEIIAESIRATDGSALISADDIGQVRLRWIQKSETGGKFLVTGIRARSAKNLALDLSVSIALDVSIAPSGEMRKRTRAMRDLAVRKPPLYPSLRGQWWVDGQFWVTAEKPVPGDSLWSELRRLLDDNTLPANIRKEAIKDIVREFVRVYLSAWKAWKESARDPDSGAGRFVVSPDYSSVVNEKLIDVSTLQENLSPADIAGSILLPDESRFGLTVNEHAEIVVESALEALGEDEGREFLRSARDESILNALDRHDRPGNVFPFRPVNSILYWAAKALRFDEKKSKQAGRIGLFVEIPALIALAAALPLPMTAGFLLGFAGTHSALQRIAARREARAPPGAFQTVNDFIIQFAVFLPYLLLGLPDISFLSGSQNALFAAAAAAIHFGYDFNGLFRNAAPVNGVPQSAEVIRHPDVRMVRAARGPDLALSSDDEARGLLPLPAGDVRILVMSRNNYPNELILRLFERGDETPEEMIARSEHSTYRSKLLYTVHLRNDKEDPSVVWLKDGGPADSEEFRGMNPGYTAEAWYSEQLAPWLAARGFREIRVIESPLKRPVFRKSLKFSQRDFYLYKDLTVVRRAVPTTNLLWLQRKTLLTPGPLEISSVRDVMDLLPVPPVDTWTLVKNDADYPETLNISMYERTAGEPEAVFRSRIIDGTSDASLLFTLSLNVDFLDRRTLWLGPGLATPKLKALFGDDGYASARWDNEKLVPWAAARGFTRLMAQRVYGGDEFFAAAGYKYLSEQVVDKWIGEREAAVSGLEPGPAMRLSGQGLTGAQHSVVNDAVREFFAYPDNVNRRRELDKDGDEYLRLDPEGELRRGYVRIYVFDGLIERIREIAAGRNVVPPSDLLSHPGRIRGKIYIDSEMLDALLEKQAEWLAVWARHEAGHIRHPSADEKEIQEQYPLPELPPRSARISWADGVRFIAYKGDGRQNIPEVDNALADAGVDSGRGENRRVSLALGEVVAALTNYREVLLLKLRPSFDVDSWPNVAGPRAKFELRQFETLVRLGALRRVPGPMLSYALSGWLLRAPIHKIEEILEDDAFSGREMSEGQIEAVRARAEAIETRRNSIRSDEAGSANSIAYAAARALRGDGRNVKIIGLAGLGIEIPILIAAGFIASAPLFAGGLFAFTAAHIVLERIAADREGRAQPGMRGTIRNFITQFAVFLPYMLLDLPGLPLIQEYQGFAFIAAAAGLHIGFDLKTLLRRAPEEARGESVESEIAGEIVAAMERISRADGSGAEIAESINAIMAGAPLSQEIEAIGGPTARAPSIVSAPAQANAVLFAMRRVDADALRLELSRHFKERFARGLSEDEANRLAARVLLDGYPTRSLGDVLRGDPTTRRADPAERPLIGAVIDPSSSDPVEFAAALMREHRSSRGDGPRLSFLFFADSLTRAQKSDVAERARALGASTDFAEGAALFIRSENARTFDISFAALDGALTQWIGDPARFSSYQMIIPKNLMGDLSGLSRLPSGSLLRRAAIILIDRSLKATPVLNANDFDDIRRAAALIARQA